MVVGFDLVCEEDYTPQLDEYVDMIYAAREKAKQMGRDFPVYLHAGESNRLNNTNIYDAVLLGSKRIGHGFNLAHRPALMKAVKDMDICIECCPISNFVLGYVLDLRTHPCRMFLHAGLPVAISPDDPAFMGYEGVTLDYVYAYLAWDLDIADLKKLALNSIKYSSVSEEDKVAVGKFFNYKWDRFLDYVLGRY